MDDVRIGAVQSSPLNKKLTRFRERIGKLVIAGIAPFHMESQSQDEAERLSPHMENFVSWYCRLAQENLGAMHDLFEELKQVLPGFSSFSLKDRGEGTKVLKVLFDSPDRSGKTMVLDFGELSDGQRVLIALYTLLYGLKNESLAFFLDEPVNHVFL